MPAPEKADLDLLLAHAGWARALARSLVRDSHRADDLVQNAWLAAIEHPPRSTTHVRAWLAAVLRNFARQDARSEKRRGRREERGARPEALPAPDVLGEEVELQRTLLAAVHALDEPYRSTIWARYYEGLAPRAISARDGVALKTVKTRLHRGLGELRGRLDREHGGDRRAWLAALMPLAKPPSFSATTWGALLLSTKVKVACALVVLVGSFAAWRLSIDSSAIEPGFATDSARPTSALESDPRREPELAAPTAERARAALETPTAAPQAAVANATEPSIVRGRVLNLERRPVAGVAIALRTDSSSSKDAQFSEHVLDIVSGHDGRFELPSPQQGFELTVRSEAWVAVYAARLWTEKTHPDVTILVAPRRPLAGVVVDGERRGIANAGVEIVVDAGLRRELGVVLDANIALAWRTTTDATGHFELNYAPLVPSRIAARAIGWAERSIEPPELPTYNLEIALDPLDKPHALVRGRVVDPEHRPVEGAYVVLGPETRTSRADGEFEFDLDTMEGLDWMTSDGNGNWRHEYDARSIVAAKPGYLPARTSIPSADELRRQPTGGKVELVLGATPLEIRGRVIDTDGHAVPNVVIRLRGETVFGQIARKTDTAEMKARTTTEGLLRGTFGQSDVVSGADGAFAIPGLLDKEYGLLALDKRTLRMAAMESVHAGSSEVAITLASEKDCVRVAGRVVSPGGEPIAGVRVHVGRKPIGSAPQEGPMFGSFAETDKRGHFEFAKLAPADLDFQVSSQSIFVLLGWKPKPEDSLDDLSIIVSRRCHLRVDLGARKSAADRAVFVDSLGKPVKLMKVQGDRASFPDRIAIVDGLSEPIVCDETARTVVLYSGEHEVERVPFTPKPGELVVVRP